MLPSETEHNWKIHSCHQHEISGLQSWTKSRINEFTDVNDCLGISITLVTTRSPLEITRIITSNLWRLNVQYEPHTYIREILSVPETTRCYEACVLSLVLTPYYHISTWAPFNDPDQLANFKHPPALTGSLLWLSSTQKEHTRLAWNGSSMILIQEKNHKDQKNTLFAEISSFWEKDFSTRGGNMRFFIHCRSCRNCKWMLGSVFR